MSEITPCAASRRVHQIRISHREHAVIGRERSKRARMRGVRLVAEDEFPALLLEQSVQRAMHIPAMRADVNAPDLSLEQVDERRNDQDLRLLDVGLQIVDAVERTENIAQ